MDTQAKRIFHARLLAGLTQAELAQKAGLSVGCISRLENNRRTRTYHQFAIADALGVSARWLFTGEGEMLE